MENLAKNIWPLKRLEEGMEALATRSGLAMTSTAADSVARTHQATTHNVPVKKWVETGARYLGLEAEPIDVTYVDLKAYLQTAKTLVVSVPGPHDAEARFLIVLRVKRNHVYLLTPDYKEKRVALDDVFCLLCSGYEKAVLSDSQSVFDALTLKPKDKDKVIQSYLKERLNAVMIPGLWTVRVQPGSSFVQQMKQAGLFKAITGYIGLYALQYALFLFSWGIIGLGALQGSLNFGWLMAWAILLITLVPLTMWSSWLASIIAIGTGSLMKRRLLAGALKLKSDETRRLGLGQFLSRVIESENMETLTLSGGFLTVVALIEIVGSIVVLSFGGFGLWTTLLLIVWTLLILYLGYHYCLKRYQWTQTRLEATHDLLEKIVGHRTRVMQESQKNWYEHDDVILEKYSTASKGLDKMAAFLFTSAARGWLVLGILILTPLFVFGEPNLMKAAIALGGILLGNRAFKKLTQGMTHMADAFIAWQQVKQLFHAASREERSSSPTMLAGLYQEETSPNDVMLRGQDLFYAYERRSDPVLDKCDLAIKKGEKILFEGASGSGKSTLASVLTGLRDPLGGVLLFQGLDRYTLGLDAWRQAVASAPQFHENHVLTATFGFNLLMGRDWPPTQADFAKAHEICQELGLTDVLSRMPAGFLQMVGETGWQLSHGERSRLYVARALLQEAKVIILDESFAALDPENLKQCIDCVRKRAETLVVIAHP
jgi:ATP-binding cassette, subfamily B, bacterial